jgi:glycosyltransferase involved in cell wall biosynthesis
MRVMELSVSVVIATNRDGAYLEEAIRSVRAQSQPVSEIIVIDDGGLGDNLRTTALRLGVRYARQKASGVSVARNHGARIAKGEWVAFLDDDDVWHPERIASQSSALREAPQAIACCSGGWHIDADGVPAGSTWAAGSTDRDRVLSGDGLLPRMITLLILRSAFLDVGGFSPALRIAEDKDLTFRLLLVGDIIAVDRPLVGYRRHGGNSTNHDRLFGRTSSLRAITLQVWAAEARASAHDRGLLVQNLKNTRKWEADGAVRDGLVAARRGRPGEAMRSLRWAFRLLPREAQRALAGVLTRRARESMARQGSQS